MRIVYDVSGYKPLSLAPHAQGAKESSVIVIRIGRDLDGSNSGAREADVGRPEGMRPELRARDREVRGHEQAHLSALGPYAASMVQFDTVTTARGESAALGGRIAVDLSEVPGDPQATLKKARTILNAAQAPGNPSAADMRVAADAYRLMLKARSELGVSEYA